MIALGMDYIWRHGASDIQMSAPVGSKCKMDNLQQNSVDAKRPYGEARHLVGALQGGGVNAANVCTMIALGMYYIWRHGASDIQM